MQLDSSPDTAIADDYKALTTAQNEIIDRIANLEGAIGTSEDKNLLASLRDHKAAYNELADQLLNRQRQIPRFDPLEKLPPELWIRIIFMLLAPYWLPDSAAASYSIDVDLAFSLTLVSKRWQHAILGFPQFWTYISVDPTCPDSMVKAFTCLELSANLPVSLCLSRLSNIEWDMIGPHIIRNKHRIHRFWMIGGERSDETIYLGRQEFLMILLPLPNLRWVGSLFGIDHELEKKILGACPLLEGMVLRNITESFPDDINLDRFTHVKLPVSEIPLLLERSPPSLEDVEVVYSAGPGDHSGPLVDAPLLNGGDLRWRSLTWFDVHHSLPMKLLRRLVNLTSLAVDAIFSDVGELFIQLHNLSMLRRLVIFTQIPSIVCESFPTITAVRPCLTIQDFEINSRHTSISNTEDSRRNIKRLGDVLNSTINSAQKVRTDWFESIKYSPSNDCWTHLDALTIYTEPTSILLDEAWHVPSSVRYLSLSCFREQWMALSSLSVIELQIIDFGDVKTGEVGYNDSTVWKEQAYTCTFDQSRWPNLRKLHICSQSYPIHITSFHSVTELRLGVGVMYDDRDPLPESFVTAICCELASDSSLFPNLISLWLDDWTEWDIFFIMLERRNLHFRSKVATIRKVVLPLHFADAFFQPIQDILCGNFPRRPSNYSLSLARNLEIMNDESISECLSCLQLFIPCDQKRKKSKETHPINVPKDDFIPYPTSEVDILSTWKTRNEIWNEKWYPVIRQQRKCCKIRDYMRTIRQEGHLGVWRS